jgi:hypothetical protein
VKEDVNYDNKGLFIVSSPLLTIGVTISVTIGEEVTIA